MEMGRAEDGRLGRGGGKFGWRRGGVENAIFNG